MMRTMTMNTQRYRRALAVLVTVPLTLVMTASNAGAARASKGQTPPKTTVVVAPYTAPTTWTSGCASQINPTSSCRESVTAAPSGDSAGDIDAVVGANVVLDRSYGAYAEATFVVPITTTVTRRSITVDALVRVHNAASVMDRPQYSWQSGWPVVKTEAWALMNYDGCCGAAASGGLTLTSVESHSSSDTHLESRVANSDRHVTFVWAPTGGIPAGTNTVTIELRQQVDAASNGHFQSTLDATLTSVTFTER